MSGCALYNEGLLAKASSMSAKHVLALTSSVVDMLHVISENTDTSMNANHQSAKIIGKINCVYLMNIKNKIKHLRQFL